MNTYKLNLIKGMVLLIMMFFMINHQSVSVSATVPSIIKLFDNADLFTMEEEKELEQKIEELEQKMDVDVVIVTINDADGKSSQDYADDYFDDGYFGKGSSHDGILFLIDMDNRQLTISTSGSMIRYMTDDRINKTLDSVSTHASSQDFYKAAVSFLDNTYQYYKEGIPKGQYNYDPITGKVDRYRSIKCYEAVLSVLAACGIGAGICYSIYSQYTMKNWKRKSLSFSNQYQESSKFSYDIYEDAKTGQYTTKRKIQQSSSSSGGSHSSSGRSTTHTSRSGRSHGGGSRSF